MDFSGPEVADLAEVRALNVAFLTYLSGADGGRLRSEFSDSLRGAVGGLSDRNVQRLSTVPFLLMACKERDDRYWEPVANDHAVHDLFAPPPVEADPISQIACATMGFLWQLSRRNSYAARMVCGATVGWCEQLAARSLFEVLQRTVIDLTVLTPRLAGDQMFWQRLLSAGLSSNTETRRAAHLSALQTVLKPTDADQVRRFKSAACQTSVPALRVSQKRDK